MGTRADFYVGTGDKAEWLGSVGWDGYEWSEDKDNLISASASEAGFRVAVNKMLSGRGDAAFPEDGWPWPWDDSRTTDYAYCFDGTQVVAYCFGRIVTGDEDSEDYIEPPKSQFPDMSQVKNTTLGPRSGVIAVSS